MSCGMSPYALMFPYTLTRFLANIPMFVRQHAHACQLTSPCCLQRPVHSNVLLDVLFLNVDVHWDTYVFGVTLCNWFLYETKHFHTDI